MHTIVLHRIEVKALQVRQEEGVLDKVPGAVANNHCVGRIGCRPRSRQRVGRRHDGGHRKELPSDQGSKECKMTNVCRMSRNDVLAANRSCREPRPSERRICLNNSGVLLSKLVADRREERPLKNAASQSKKGITTWKIKFPGKEWVAWGDKAHRVLGS